MIALCTAAGALAGCLVASPVVAQGSRLSVGPVVGLSLADVTGDDAQEAETMTRFMVGGFLGIRLSPLFSIEPALHYAAKGAKSEQPGTTFKNKLSYLELPVLAKVEIPAQGSVRPYFVAGPALAFELSCKVEGESNGVSAEVDCDAGGATPAGAVDGFATKSVDFGAVFGGGLGFTVGGNTLTFGVTYDRGLFSFADESENADLKNAVLSFVAGFAFRLGR